MNATRSDTTDRDLFDHLRRTGSASVGELAEMLGVTAPAVRQRLSRLMAEGLLDRVIERHGRGRPSHRYRLTKKGERTTGDNYFDLAAILWDEIRQVEDAEVRNGLLRRLAKRLADAYSGQVGNTIGQDDLRARMRDLARLMGEREVPFEVDESGDLPIINALACPYPALAENDRSICTLERMMMSEVLGEAVKLSECRLDGDCRCSFEPEVNDVEPDIDGVVATGAKP